MGRLPERIARRLRLPVIAAPMLRVSGVDLVTACCRAGVIGSFPTANARTVEQLDEWITAIKAGLGRDDAPWAANLIIRNPRMPEDLEVLVRHEVELVITSVGSPVAAIPPLREAGALVFADIATLHHARKAVEAGVDGLVLLCAGAGGQTGWANPFAFARAVRKFFDGPVVLAGGLSDGAGLRAVEALGCDLGYLGTRFIATAESMADERYKAMLVACELDDIHQTRALTGLPANMLRPSLEAAGLRMEELDETATPAQAKERYGGGSAHDRPTRWRDIWSGGHSVSGVGGVPTVAALVAEMEGEYRS